MSKFPHQEAIDKYESAKREWLDRSKAFQKARTDLEDAADKMERAGAEMMRQLQESVDRRKP